MCFEPLLCVPKPQGLPFPRAIFAACTPLHTRGQSELGTLDCSPALHSRAGSSSSQLGFILSSPKAAPHERSPSRIECVTPYSCVTSAGFFGSVCFSVRPMDRHSRTQRRSHQRLHNQSRRRPNLHNLCSWRPKPRRRRQSPSLPHPKRGRLKPLSSPANRLPRRDRPAPSFGSEAQAHSS